MTHYALIITDAEKAHAAADYRYLIQPYDRNPSTNARITEAEVDAMEAGFEKTV